MRTIALAATFALACAAFCRSGELPRKGKLGVALSPVSNGLKVQAVAPNLGAANMAVEPGDVITAMNGHAYTKIGEFVQALRRMSVGDKITLELVRNGQSITKSGPLTPRPEAREPNLDVIYDQAGEAGHRVRLIVTKPRGQGSFPCVFLIGGIGAYSVDGSFATCPYGDVLAPLANSGFVTVRVEKPGQGDSDGPEYKRLTFNEETAAYLAALRHTKKLPFVDANRIAIFGHSMGGCFAPVVAAQEPVKAMVVSGTLFKNFEEYMLENSRRQSELADEPQETLARNQHQLNESMHYLLDERQTPAQVAAAHPDLAAFLKELSPDGETISGVGIPFFRELTQIDLPAQWKAAKSNVLVIYDENDFLSGRDDHERIAAYVNGLRPGTAEFKLLPGIDHFFVQTDSMRDSLKKMGNGPHNPIFSDTVLAYMKRQLVP